MNKKRLLNFSALLIVIILVLYFTLKDDFYNIINQISKVNISIFVLVLILFLLSLLFKSFSLNIFINEYKEYKLSKSYELTLISQFLNGITPFQTGGQPFQIYLLKKDGVRITDSTNAMIKDFVAFQSALIIVGIIGLLLNIKVHLFGNNKYLSIMVILGFLINFIVLGILLFILCSKKRGYNAFNKLIDWLFSLRLLRRFEDKKKSLKSALKHFYDNRKSISNNKFNLFRSILYNVVHLSLLYVLPIVIFKSIGVTDITLRETYASTAFVMLIGNFIPVPGATGGIEYGFLQFFGNFIKGAALSSGMLLWRFATYFFGMIIGSLVLLFKKKGGKK